MALRRVGIQLVAEDGDQFLRTAKDADRAVDQLGQSSQATAKKMDGAFSEIVRGAQRQLGAQFVNLTMQAGHALVDFFTGSITQAGQFESTMNRFASVTGQSLSESGKSVQDFSKLFIQLGQDTQYSAQQAGDAAVELAKGGLDPATIAAGALADTLSLASAGELGLADAATIVAKQLGVWKDTGVDSAQVADRLAQAANASTVDVKELALGLANAGGAAKGAGVSFDETVQTLALLAPGFSSASDAGTSFKTFLAALQPTTKPATEAMEALGLYTKQTGSLFYDAQGRFIGMDAATKLLHDSTSGLTEAQRSLQLRLIFGQDAQRAALMLAEQGAEGFDKMGTAMGKAGSATEQAEKKHKGYAVAIQELQGSLETLQISLGQKFIPMLTDLAHAATTAVNNLTELANINNRVADTENHIFDLADSYDDYAKKVAYADVEIQKFNNSQGGLGYVFGTNARMIEKMTKSQYDFVQSLIASGVPMKDAVAQGQGIGELAKKFEQLKAMVSPETAAQLDALSSSMFGLGAASPDTAAKLQSLIVALGNAGAARLLTQPEIVAALTGELAPMAAQALTTEMATGRMGAAMERSANQAKLYGVGLRGVVQEITQTPEQLAAVEQAIKDADKAMLDGTKALSVSIATRVSFFDDLDKRAADHNAKMAELETAYDAESSAKRKAAIVVQMQTEMGAYATSDQQAAAHYAEQIAAQQAALGEQLYNWVTAQQTMGTIADGKAVAIKAAIQTQFGIADTSTAVLFDHMTQSILKWGENGTMTADEFVLSLVKSENAAGDSQRAQEALATQLTGQLTAAYRAGQLSADEYDAALRKIPAEVKTQVNYDINRAQMIKDIDDAQKGAYDSGKKVGWSISQGIAAGIASGAVSINPAIVGAVNNAVAAGKRAAGIASPSKLFADEIGSPIIDGIVKPIEEGKKDFGRVVGGIVGDAGTAIDKLIAKLGVGSSGIHKAMGATTGAVSEGAKAITLDIDAIKKAMEGFTQFRIGQNLDRMAMTTAHEINDLDFAGGGKGVKKQYAIREQTEREAEQRLRDAEAHSMELAKVDVQLAEDVYKIQTDSISQRQSLDETYYKKKKQLSRNPTRNAGALSDLETEYQQALAAMKAQESYLTAMAEQKSKERTTKVSTGLIDDIEAAQTGAYDAATALGIQIAKGIKDGVGTILITPTLTSLGSASARGGSGGGGRTTPTDTPSTKMPFEGDSGRDYQSMNKQVAMPSSTAQIANTTYNSANTHAFTYAPTYHSQQAPAPAMDYAQARALAQMGG